MNEKRVLGKGLCDANNQIVHLIETAQHERRQHDILSTANVKGRRLCNGD